MAEQKYVVTAKGLEDIKKAQLVKLQQKDRSVRGFAECVELKNALKRHNALEEYKEHKITYNPSDWNHMQEGGRGVRLAQILVVLDALALPNNPAYYKEATPEDKFAMAYKSMQCWHRFPVPLFSGDTTLDEAMQSQVLIRKEKKEGDKEKKGGDATPELSLRDASLHEVRFHQEMPPEALSVLDMLASLRNKPPRLLILGEAGDGKSTLARMLGRAYLEQGAFPVLIRARAWEDSGKSLSDYLGENYFAEEEEDALKTGGALLWEKVKAGNAPLLIDGLDETQSPEDIGTKLERVAQTCRGMDGKGAEPVIVVTSRRQGYEEALRSFHFARVELKTFDFEKQVKPYISKRLPVDAPELIKRLKEDSRTRALTGNGLMLAMLCTRWEELKAAGGSERFELPVSRGELYDWAVKRLLIHPHKTRRVEHTTFYDKFDLKVAILAAIAFHAQLCHGRTLTIERRLVERALEEVTSSGTPDAGDHALRHAILDDIVLNSELLSRDASGTIYRFFHPTFQEYFAALYMVQHWNAEGWRDWLPTREGWQEWGYPNLPWRKASEERREMLTQDFECPYCGNKFLPFPDMLLRPEYRETYLLMVGLLNNTQKEAVFLNGIARSLPPIRGYESDTYRKDVLFRSWFNEEDTLLIEMWMQGIQKEKTAWPYLDEMVAYDDVRAWLEWGLQAVSRCGGKHSEVVERILAGLQAISRPSDYNISLQLLGKSREPAHTTAGVKFYCSLLNKMGTNSSRALAALGAIGSVEAVPALIAFLKDEEASKGIQWEAIVALGEIGSTEVVSALLDVLKGKEINADRWRAANALGKIGSVEAVPSLIEVLKDEKTSHDIRSQVADALGAIGSVEAVSALLDVLKDEEVSKGIRHDAAEALGKIGSVEAVPSLIEVLKDEKTSHDIRSQVADALGAIGSVEAVSALIAFLKDEEASKDNRKYAPMMALGAIRNVEAVPALLDVLKDEEAHTFIRRQAAEALGEIGSVEAVPALLDVLKDEEASKGIQWEAIVALVKIGNTETIPVLLDVLKDEEADLFVRWGAAKALVKIRSVEAVPALLDVLKDEEAHTFIRRQAAEALVKIRSVEAVPALITFLEDKEVSKGIRWGASKYAPREADVDIRSQAAGALGEIGSVEAVSALIAFLKDEEADLETLWTVVEVLGAIRSVEAVPALFDVLKDEVESSNTRWRAAKALGEIGSVEAVSALLDVLKDEKTSHDIRHDAAEALGKIGSEEARLVLEQFYWEAEINATKDISMEAVVRALLNIRDRKRAYGDM